MAQLCGDMGQLKCDMEPRIFSNAHIDHANWYREFQKSQVNTKKLTNKIRIEVMWKVKFQQIQQFPLNNNNISFTTT